MMLIAPVIGTIVPAPPVEPMLIASVDPKLFIVMFTGSLSATTLTVLPVTVPVETFSVPPVPEPLTLIVSMPP